MGRVLLRVSLEPLMLGRAGRTQVLLKGLAEFGEETGRCAEGTCQRHRVLPVAQT